MSFPVLGTAQLGMNYGIANKTGMPDMKEATNIVAYALANGIEQLDTAQAYGQSEVVLGRISKNLGKTIKFISKIHPDTNLRNPMMLEQALTQSLQNLKTDYLHGYMLHNATQLRQWDKGLHQVLDKLKKKGMIKHLGVSVYTPGEAQKAITTDGIDLIQIPSNLLDRRFETVAIFQAASKRKKTIYIRSIFLQGLLLIDPADLSDSMQFAYKTLEKFHNFSTGHQVSKMQLAVDYAKTAYKACGILMGAETLGQIKENLKIWHSRPNIKIMSMIPDKFKNVSERVLNPSRWPLIKTLAVLQARMSSSRLPQKVLKKIMDKPMLQLQIERILQAKKIDYLVVATSVNPEDEAIEQLCEELGIECFRGSLDHVLDRFYQAARQFNAKTVMRLTGDCPLTDPEKLDDLVDFFESKDVDYASNCIPPTLPDGLDAEIFTMAALENAWKNAVLPSETEHVTPYLRDEKNGFITACKTYEPSTAGLRWCVDNPEDFEFAKSVYEHLYPTNPQFTTDDILDLLKRKPSLSTINSHIDRNEGALKALKLDKKFLKNK